MACRAASSMKSGPSWSGKPWPRFTEPVASASADISAKIVVVDEVSRCALHGEAMVPTLVGRLVPPPMEDRPFLTPAGPPGDLVPDQRPRAQLVGHEWFGGPAAPRTAGPPRGRPGRPAAPRSAGRSDDGRLGDQPPRTAGPPL